MNRIYRVIFNKCRGLFTVVNENTLSNSKGGRQGQTQTGIAIPPPLPL